MPCSNWFRELPQQSLAAAGWFGFRAHAFLNADDSFAAEIYPALHRYLHETWKVDVDGLAVERSNGWNWADAGMHIDKTALLQPWYYLALKAEREFALQLGKLPDAEEDARMMERLKESYNRLFWNGSCYITPGHDGPADDRVQALAAVSGLAGPDKHDAILKVLDERCNAESYMMRFVLDAYFLTGHPEKGLARLKEYAAEVMSEGSSTLLEHRSRNGSSNHAWSGHGIVLMGQRVAGIEPLEPGFRVFSVKPQMASLKHVECGLETSYGMIEVVLDRKGRRIQANVSVPQGATAVLTDSRGRELRLQGGLHRRILL